MTETKPDEIYHVKPRLYYGYFVALAGLLIMIAAYGARFSFGVFFSPLIAEFGWSNAATSSAFSLSIIIEGIFGILLGGLTDRYGPRVVLTFSSVVMFAGYFLLSQVTSLWQLYLYYGVILGIGFGGIMVPVVTVIARWFIKRRGTMTSIVMAGTGIGTVICSPVSNYLISIYDWRTSSLLTGVFVLVIVGLAAQFLKRDPAKMGLVAYGEIAGTKTEMRSGIIGLSLKEAMHTKQLWLLVSMFISFGFCVFAASVHIVPYVIESGTSPADAANILAIIGAAVIIGRLILGVISDRTGNRLIFIVGFISIAAASFWLIPASTIWAFTLFALVFGFFQGGLGSAEAPLTSSLFGLKYHGLIFGIAGFSFTLGGGIGPFVTGIIFDATGSYKMAFLAWAVISIAGLVLALLIKPLKVSAARI